MKFTPHQQLVAKTFLDTLDKLGVMLPADTVFDEVERAISQPVGKDDRGYLSALMEEEGWLSRHVDRFTGRITVLVTAAGAAAKERL